MFAVFHLQDFALQAALRHSPELHVTPVALVEERTAVRAVIVQVTDAAREAGVRPGMTSTQGLARCRKLTVRIRSDAQEASAQEALMQFAYGFSPFLEATAPGVCTVDLRGNPERCTETLVGELAALHLRARIGVAETPDLAWLAARRARPFLRVERSLAFLDTLPVEALEPPPEILQILEKWGIRTLGEFAALGRQALVERLGTEAGTMFDRARGTVRRPLKLTTPPERYAESVEFEQEIELLEPLLFMLRRFLEQIARRLERAWLAAGELRLRLVFCGSEDYSRIFRVPAPTCDVDMLFRMLHTHLEGFRAPHPVVALHLEAMPCRPENRQSGLFETMLRDPNGFCETLARLTALLGPGRVGCPVVEPTHRPDAFHVEPLPPECDIRHSKFGNPPLLPLRRFRPPVPIHVRLRNGVPVLTSGEPGLTVGGPLKAARGPWRSSGDWWDRKVWSRREWDVELAEGGLCRLHEDGERWFADGVYD